MIKKEIVAFILNLNEVITSKQKAQTIEEKLEALKILRLTTEKIKLLSQKIQEEVIQIQTITMNGSIKTTLVSKKLNKKDKNVVKEIVTGCLSMIEEINMTIKQIHEYVEIVLLISKSVLAINSIAATSKALKTLSESIRILGNINYVSLFLLY